THQHLGEIHESLHQLQESFPGSPLGEGRLHFVPWRGDFTRGIFISSQIRTEKRIEELGDLYKDFYTGHPFTLVTKEQVFLKQVVNTNKCIIQLEKVGSILVVHSVADNLLKGASGQAVQNMNLMFGLSETAGLHLKANYF
ncbi:MAG TPA: N-acetyl-gamma-glutamyl-phosphate reductase, partial [Chitinophagaceae bacterium]|nr:N-acetyl-gamma-glutamyl-phosphate reductase [Chitinophagaceae bacterium]